MSRIDINRAFDVYGEFWVAGQEDKVARGRMYRDETGIRIQLFDDLRPGPSYVPVPGIENSSWEIIESPSVDLLLTIHGHLGGMLGRVTAIECRTVNSTVGRLRGPQEHILMPLRVMVGAHVSGVDQEFTGARVRLHHLDEWAGLKGFALEISEDKKKFKLSYEEPSVESVSLANGGQLTIGQSLSIPPLSVAGGALRRDVWICVEQLPKMTWEEISRTVLRPLESFVTLCLGVQSKLSNIKLTVDGGNWMQVTGGWLQAEPTDGDIGEPVAYLPKIGLGALGNWLDKVAVLGPLPPVVARFSAKQQTVHLETELLEMATVAEGLHAKLFPSEVRLDQKTLDRVRAALGEAVADEEERVRNIIGGMLTHLAEPGYPARLKQLAERVRGCAPEITGKTNRWAAEVSKARNSYAHRTASGFLTEENIDTLFTVIESLRWLLRCVLLLEAGISESYLAKQLERVSAYRLFLGRAVESLPRIYVSRAGE
ncbi:MULTISPECIES: HEPN domain-containing protein [unclassified Amycolatopsis]|uniref:ApeA N-terminal domain 1-containing protein n=1 Tax=unclassified Amycolatopsis TaxID=2618356 RepID=UPI0028766D29|nr:MULTISPECIES: HEPN domain-containing protein [unclassified Amycolatopsis]MDS0133200.1 hypothetical protein [Amycolatopsis sp. 505]MDS0146430.1 hypothetical protein [Amycolatopsis sp. CM201R]